MKKFLFLAMALAVSSTVVVLVANEGSPRYSNKDGTPSVDVQTFAMNDVSFRYEKQRVDLDYSPSVVIENKNLKHIESVEPAKSGFLPAVSAKARSPGTGAI